MKILICALALCFSVGLAAASAILQKANYAASKMTSQNTQTKAASSNKNSGAKKSGHKYGNSRGPINTGNRGGPRAQPNHNRER